MRTCERHAGFTLIGLLFLIAGLGVAMAALGTVWQTTVQREKEAELLFIGEQYRKALASYRRATPGTVKTYPASLEDLLRDPRFPNTVRHLRRVYRDPMTGDKEWGVARDAANGIVGVYSLSEKAPRKRAGFAAGLEAFADAKQYRDWVFRADTKPDAAADSAAGVARSADQTGQSGLAGTPGNGGTVSGSPASPSNGAINQVDPCVSAYQGQMSLCRPSYQSGDLAAWRACTSAALLSRIECGKAGGR